MLGAADRIRVGVIGAGDRGMELVAQIRACPHTEIGAFADIYSGRRERAQNAIPGAQIIPITGVFSKTARLMPWSSPRRRICTPRSLSIR